MVMMFILRIFGHKQKNATGIDPMTRSNMLIFNGCTMSRSP